MKKFLPKNSKKGFTLIELLVVIAIIAILSVIAISIYFGAQASARDGRRRAEIDSLAKSIEISKEPISGNYIYEATRSGNDYPDPARFPQDPTPSTRAYCIAKGTSPAPPGNPLPADWPSGPSACPTAPSGYTAIAGFPSPIIAGPLGAPSWKICALLEASATVICRASLTKP